MPEAKINWTKNAKFWWGSLYYDVIFCWKFWKSSIAGWAKKSKGLKWPEKFLNYFFQWYLTPDQKSVCIYFWNLDINAKLKKKNEKKKRYIFKYFKKFRNSFWSPSLINFWLRNFWDYFRVMGFFPHPACLIFLFFSSKRRHSKSDVIKPLFFGSIYFFLWKIIIVIYQKHI